MYLKEIDFLLLNFLEKFLSSKQNFEKKENLQKKSLNFHFSNRVEQTKMDFICIFYIASPRITDPYYSK